MSDLIERGDVFKSLWARHKHEGADLDALITMEDALEAVVSIPAVDAVEAKHGRWIQADLDKDYVTCSYCKTKDSKDRMAWTPEFARVLKYCPNCGAKMDGGEKDE